MELFLRQLSIRISLILLVSVHLIGQNRYDNTWVLGYSGAQGKVVSILSFVDTGLVSIVQDWSQMGLDGDGSIICDKEGKLKLVFKNCFILNANLDTIKNSDLLKNRVGYTSDCNSGLGLYPFDQTTIILPIGSEDNLYQLLFVDAGFVPRSLDSLKATNFGRLFAQQVDFKSNKRGELVGDRIEVIQDSIVPGQITACYNNYEDGWWIIARLDGTSCFAIISFNGKQFKYERKMCFGSDLTGDNDIGGCSEFSPDRKHFLHYEPGNGVYLYDFDNQTGTLSNYRKMSKYCLSNLYGRACFSPDSKLLYVFASKYLVQFQVVNGDVDNTAMIIDSFKYDPQHEYYSSFFVGKIGPDGRIYCAGLGAHQYLSVINRPNCRGSDCDLQKQSIELPVWNFWGLPDSPHFRTNTPSPSCSTNNTYNFSDVSNIECHYLNNDDAILLNSTELELNGALLRISDLSGSICQTIELNSNSNVLSVRNLNSGMYLLNIQTKSNAGFIGKFIRY